MDVIKSGLDRLMEDVRGKHARKFNALLETLDDDEFIQAYGKILEYAAPKMQRVEHVGDGEDNEIRIIHVSKEDKHDDR